MKLNHNLKRKPQNKNRNNTINQLLKETMNQAPLEAEFKDSSHKCQKPQIIRKRPKVEHSKVKIPVTPLSYKTIITRKNMLMKMIIKWKRVKNKMESPISMYRECQKINKVILLRMEEEGII